jgi:hypothetical protein
MGTAGGFCARAARGESANDAPTSVSNKTRNRDMVVSRRRETSVANRDANVAACASLAHACIVSLFAERALRAQANRRVSARR